MNKLLFLSFASILLSACSSEVGSKEWCEDLKDKPNGEWTVKEAKDYTSHCLFK